MNGEWLLGLEILAIRRDPIRGQVALRGAKIKLSRADKPVESILQRVFGVGIPGTGSVGLGP
jgi:hypothetical protein